MPFKAYLESKPILAGLFATISGWSGAIFNSIENANKLVTFIGACFGTVAAFFTMLLLIRKWYRGRAKEQTLD